MEPQEDYCDNCGTFAAGREQWMFSSLDTGKRFYCFRCLTRMRLYAAVGFTLLAIVLLALIGSVLWLRALV